MRSQSLYINARLYLLISRIACANELLLLLREYRTIPPVGRFIGDEPAERAPTEGEAPPKKKRTPDTKHLNDSQKNRRSSEGEKGRRTNSDEDRMPRIAVTADASQTYKSTSHSRQLSRNKSGSHISSAASLESQSSEFAPNSAPAMSHSANTVPMLRKKKGGSPGEGDENERSCYLLNSGICAIYGLAAKREAIS